MAEITVRSLTGLQQQIIAAPHTFIGDEPVAWEGEGLGPTPYEILLGALGTCTNMAVLNYARRKGWALDGVETRLTHTRVYGEDCLHCEEEGRQLDLIQRFITLRGEMDDDQVHTLKRVAAHCPVGKSLAQGVELRDTISRA